MKTILLSLILFSTVAHAELFREILKLEQYPNNSEFYYTQHSLAEGLSVESELPNLDENGKQPSYNATVDCNQKIKIKQEFLITKSPSSHHKINIYGRSNSLRLLLTNNANCTLSYETNSGINTINIKPYTQKFSVLKDIEFGQIDSVARKSKLLSDGEEAINRRIEILSGYKLTKAQLDQRDPAMKLDLDPARLPSFDYIYVSTLQINNDFVTNILFRLLAAHAKKGTPVVFTASQILVAEKENAALTWLQKQSNNIKIILYKYVDKDPSLKDRFDSLHRVSHSKLFITYSKDHPELNHFIAGGRNMSDRYFFSTQSFFEDKSYTDFENEKLNPWVHFYDMDFEVQSAKLCREVLLNALDFSEITKSNIKSKELILSIPFQDGRVMEDRFVELIDNAHESIEILSPYIYFTDKIQEAFERADKRGVKVKMIISLSLLGDAMTKQLKDIYDSFLDRVSDYIEIYQYPTSNRTIMHRKGMLIDGKIAVLGSVNLSQRSFFHDIESAFVSDDQMLVPEFNEEYQRMLKISKKIDRKFDRNFKIINAFKLEKFL